MGEVHNAVPAARGHGISIRKDGGEEFLYLAPADSGIAFTKGQDRPHYQARLKRLERDALRSDCFLFPRRFENETILLHFVNVSSSCRSLSISRSIALQAESNL
jgi:hypothetical protein